MLEVLRDVYRKDKAARDKGMSDEQRLRHPRKHSAGLMTGLVTWFKEEGVRITVYAAPGRYGWPRGHGEATDMRPIPGLVRVLRLCAPRWF